MNVNDEFISISCFLILFSLLTFNITLHLLFIHVLYVFYFLMYCSTFLSIKNWSRISVFFPSLQSCIKLMIIKFIFLLFTFGSGGYFFIHENQYKGMLWKKKRTKSVIACLIQLTPFATNGQSWRFAWLMVRLMPAANDSTATVPWYWNTNFKASDPSCSTR